MKHVRIIMVASTPVGARAWGEVKAVDVAGSPTIAHVEAAATWTDLFEAAPGRHSFHFRVTEPCKLTLQTVVDGAEIGPPAEFDATKITAGRRYNFEVPS